MTLSLVLGASGFAGSHLCEHLLTLDRRVVGTATSLRPGLVPEGIEWHACDVRDRPAVQELVRGLQPLRNWYLDMANEHNLRAGNGHPANKEVSFEQLARLRNAAKAVDPARLVTASYCGDASEADIRKYVGEVRLDFLSPHRQRGRTSPAETAAKTRQALAMMETIGRVVPVHYQEPFRRAFAPGWQPAAEDFVADLKGAIEGGAAGWCFHNGDARAAEGGRPRRSFDLREQRLFDQLDPEERKAVDRMAEVVRKAR